jgi:hypothetical protein
MSFVTILGILVIVVAVSVFALSARGTGDGQDLLDWDPTDRIQGRRDADLEELAVGLDEHNRRRQAAGLAPQTEDELRRALATNRRKASS